ncbi:MAG TPA: ATP-binding protein [bacterium]|nr:ATP-binding protein [bacterium]
MKKTVINLQSIRETAVKLATDFCILSRRILHYANLGTPRADFLREVSRMLLEFSHCDGIELRMRDGDLHYRWEATDGEGENYSCEKLSPVLKCSGRTIPCVDNDSWIEKLCGAVMCRHVDPATDCISAGGSFWIGNTDQPLKCPPVFSELTVEELRELTGGYQSVAFIPFELEEESRGLLQLKSRRVNFFTPSTIEFYEGLAEALGVAVSDRRAQYALRERVKELSCLYEIDELVQQQGVMLDDLLQGIVELMPPAWQYPDMASARLVVDKRSYESSNFNDQGSSLRSDIVCGDEERGFVELVYSGGEDVLETALFLEEEHNLIDSIAQHISIILERRRTEEDKRVLEEQLRHADRLATIGQLGAGVAHELNEPLTSILGFAQLSKKAPDLPNAVGGDLERIINSTLHAREIVKKLLIFSRQMPTQKSEVNLSAVAEEGLFLLDSRCEKQGIRVVKRFAPNLPLITADPSQLLQVVVNIVVNAVQAMPDGGKLTVATYADADSVYLDIEDAGTGMSRETVKKIFIPFFTTKEVGHGTGLGLPVVHGIITSHGGGIKVHSELGRGSRFIIALPIAAMPFGVENQWEGRP